MSTLVLIALIAVAFTIQVRVDAWNIARAASRRGWSVTRVTWTPWARGAALRSRAVRSYWLGYRDERGRLARCRCWVANPFDGPFGVTLEPAGVDDAEHGVPAARMGRARFIVLATSAGAFLGAALGIGGSLLLYPSSNIAPAYGLIVMAPVGLCAGALFGVLRAR